MTDNCFDCLTVKDRIIVYSAPDIETPLKQVFPHTDDSALLNHPCEDEEDLRLKNLTIPHMTGNVLEKS